VKSKSKRFACDCLSIILQILPHFLRFLTFMLLLWMLLLVLDILWIFLRVDDLGSCMRSENEPVSSNLSMSLQLVVSTAAVPVKVPADVLLNASMLSLLVSFVSSPI